MDFGFNKMTKTQMTEAELYNHCYVQAIYYLDWLISMTPSYTAESHKVMRAAFLTKEAQAIHNAEKIASRP